MTSSVIISTPIPTLEEFAKSLGISKKRQAALLRLMSGDGATRHAAKKVARNKTGAALDRPISSGRARQK